MVDQDKRTVASAHARIDTIEKQLVEIKTTVDLQFKDLFNRVKRLEMVYLKQRLVLSLHYYLE